MNDNISILIVEDNSIQAKQLKNALEKHSYTVLPIAKTCDEACMIIEKEKPDIAILDIELENEEGKKDLYGGIEVAEYIRKNHYIPFVFLTNVYENEHIKSRALKTMPSGLMDKPFSTQTLLLSIETAIANYTTQKIQITGIKNVFLLVKDNRQIMRKVFYRDIYEITVNCEQVVFETVEEKTFIYGNKTSLPKFLSENFYPDFIQIFKSIIINKEYITGYSAADSVLYVKIPNKPEKEYSLGDTFKVAFLKAWKQ